MIPIRYSIDAIDFFKEGIEFRNESVNGKLSLNIFFYITIIFFFTTSPRAGYKRVSIKTERDEKEGEPIIKNLWTIEMFLENEL